MSERLRTLPLPARILAVAGLLLIVWAGQNIPLPFINHDYLSGLFTGGAMEFINMATGGSLRQMSVFALSVTPYITASIIMQLMSVIIPPLYEMQKNGEAGRREYKKITAAAGIVFSLIQASGMAAGLSLDGAFTDSSVRLAVLAVAVWTLGGAAVIAISEYMDKFDLGQGISMILCMNILSQVPSDILLIGQRCVLEGAPLQKNVVRCAAAAAIAGCAVAAAVYGTRKKREIPLIQTRRAETAASSFAIPFFVCSVMPAVFASSLMALPSLILMAAPGLASGKLGKAAQICSMNSWFQRDLPWGGAGVVIYLALTFFCAVFYADIAVPADETARNLQKAGAVIPGVRPAKDTAAYLEKAVRETAIEGTAYMAAEILAVQAVFAAAGLRDVSVAGTSLFIVVSVLADTGRRIRAELA